MIWLAIIPLSILAILLAFPLTRRALVMVCIFTRRLSPRILVRLGLKSKDYTRARAIRLAFEDLGPAYIKFGQMIASSPTAFSEEVTQEFARCLDMVRPIPKKQVMKIIGNSLGQNPHDLFRNFDPEPLASASIAQVHTAELDDGTEIVIKVQRPGIKGRIEQDLGLMRFAARRVEKRYIDLRRANLVGIVDDFLKTIREEMDFRREANNMDAFNELLDAEEMLTIACAPKVFHDYTTDKIITMERFHGVRIDDKKGVEERVDAVLDMLRNTSRVFWSTVFLGGFFHADIHAGNIMILDDGRLGYIDFGIFGHFTLDDRIALADWVGSLISGDGERLARSIKRMGAVPDDVDWDSFVTDVTDSFLPLRALTVDKPEMLEEFLPKLRAMATKHDARLPGNFVLILKQLTYFGRYVMIHHPQFNENLDPVTQQNFLRIFMKFNQLRHAQEEKQKQQQQEEAAAS